VAPRRSSVVLQGDYAASVESSARAGYCVCGVRESTWDDRVYEPERSGTRQLLGVDFSSFVLPFTYIPLLFSANDFFIKVNDD
jgi:hypothetical protein